MPIAGAVAPHRFGVFPPQVDHAYDALNRHIKRTVDPDGATGSAAIEQTFFLYEQGQIALEFQKTGAGAVASGNLSHRYLWGPAVDMLLADEQVDWSDSDSDGEVLWALTDHLGTVRDVVDSSGELRIHRQFDAYGNVTSQTHYNAAGGVVTGGLGFVTEAFGYTGKFFDQWTGLRNNWNRWYESAKSALAAGRADARTGYALAGIFPSFKISRKRCAHGGL